MITNNDLSTEARLLSELGDKMAHAIKTERAKRQELPIIGYVNVYLKDNDDLTVGNMYVSEEALDCEQMRPEWKYVVAKAVKVEFIPEYQCVCGTIIDANQPELIRTGMCETCLGDAQ